MNKYQEALKIMCEECKQAHYCICGGFNEKCDQYAFLKELVEKAIPKTPDFNNDEDTYECPCCGKTYETYYDGYLKKFCCECGQALDWRKDEQ